MTKRASTDYKNVLVYVHGTNGSGKSTLARALIAASGGVKCVDRFEGYKKATSTSTVKGLALVGSYGAACGGVDGLSPYAAIHHICLTHSIFPKARVFAEGLITPGVETCQKLAGYFGEHLFIALATPEQDCIRNVLRRRARKGTETEYNPANLQRKGASVQSWANRLEKAGLNVARCTWAEAYLMCLNTLGIQPPSTAYLLGEIE